jgi:hypothetical protein
MNGTGSIGRRRHAVSGGLSGYVYEAEVRTRSLGYIPDTILDEKSRVPRRMRAGGGSTILVMPAEPALKGQAIGGPGFILR